MSERVVAYAAVVVCVAFMAWTSIVRPLWRWRNVKRRLRENPLLAELHRFAGTDEEWRRGKERRKTVCGLTVAYTEVSRNADNVSCPHCQVKKGD